MSDDNPNGPPSNSKLAERTARIEENVQHVAETVERIETTVTDEQEQLAAEVEENRKKIKPVHTAYRVGKWAAPVVVAAAGVIVSSGVV